MQNCFILNKLLVPKVIRVAQGLRKSDGVTVVRLVRCCMKVISVEVDHLSCGTKYWILPTPVLGRLGISFIQQRGTIHLCDYFTKAFEYSKLYLMVFISCSFVTDLPTVWALLVLQSHSYMRFLFIE